MVVDDIFPLHTKNRISESRRKFVINSSETRQKLVMKIFDELLTSLWRVCDKFFRFSNHFDKFVLKACCFWNRQNSSNDKFVTVPKTTSFWNKLVKMITKSENLVSNLSKWSWHFVNLSQTCRKLVKIFSWQVFDELLTSLWQFVDDFLKSWFFVCRGGFTRFSHHLLGLRARGYNA